MQMAFGDALAVALLEARGFSAADFRNFHPGGKLGAQLVTVSRPDGHGTTTCPRCRGRQPLRRHHGDHPQALRRRRRWSMAPARWSGAFTDGDLRRALPIAGLALRPWPTT
jgi:arabinose-5-phosphate isomerase